MKLITFAVPCYNSAAYMRHCLDTLLTGGEDVEIVIVNDGSKDDTAAIADEYAQKYPQVRAVHKENGGHGSGVNKGLELAEGLYYKVVDSDDWLDEEALAKLLARMREHRDKGCLPDLYVTNFVYEKVYANTRFVRNFKANFPVETLCGWDKVKPFHTSSVLLMHSLMYKTEKLRASGTVLPEHTFYVDNLFAYKPLPFMESIYYMDVDLYRYFIGREDQSVNEHIMIQRIDQQIAVNKLMIDAYDLWKISNRHLRHYMLNYLEIITVISTVMLIKSGTEENLAKKRELWTYIKEKDIRLFHYLRNRMMGQTLHLPGKGGRGISLTLYKISQKVIGFN